MIFNCKRRSKGIGNFLGFKVCGFCFIFFLISLMSLSHSAGAAEEPPPPPQGFGMAVGPSTIRFVGLAGEPQTAKVSIWNNGSKPLGVEVEISDVQNILDDQNKLSRRFVPPGTTSYSCGQWVVLEGTEFTVPGEDKKDISLTLSPPPNAVGGYSCVIFFRGSPTLDEKEPGEDEKPTTTVVVQPRLGVLLFYEAKGTVKREGELLSLNYIPPAVDRPLTIQYEFQNRGNTDILLTGSFHILDANSALAGKGELQPIRTFPGDRGMAETQWTGSLTPGQYELVLTFEIGPDAEEVIVKELPITIE